MEAPVGDYFVVKTKAKEGFMEEQVGNSFCGDSFLGRAENHPLSKPMVNHDQKGVKAGREGRSVIKLQEICWKGWMEVKRIGVRGGTVGCVLDLFCWQTAHPSTYLCTKDARPGHQNLEATS